jgi:hypothetical protein
VCGSERERERERERDRERGIEREAGSVSGESFNRGGIRDLNERSMGVRLLCVSVGR